MQGSSANRRATHSICLVDPCAQGALVLFVDALGLLAPCPHARGHRPAGASGYGMAPATLTGQQATDFHALVIGQLDLLQHPAID